MDHITILGLGNILYGDEGFGVLLAQHLYAGWNFPENVEVVDGGTQGQTLLTFVEQADRLLVLDAVDFGLPPGELVLRDTVPAYLTAQKIGPHQNSFSEIMGLAALRGTEPAHCALLGAQPAAMTLGAPLSPQLEKNIGKALEMALNILRQWGVAATPRTEGRHLSATALDSLANTHGGEEHQSADSRAGS
jgi:hydrogenase maturation protease